MASSLHGGAAKAAPWQCSRDSNAPPGCSSAPRGLGRSGRTRDPAARRRACCKRRTRRGPPRRGRPVPHADPALGSRRHRDGGHRARSEGRRTHRRVDPITVHRVANRACLGAVGRRRLHHGHHGARAGRWGFAASTTYLRWSASGRFSRAGFLNDDVLIEPSGRTIDVAGASVVAYVRGRPACMSCYYDSLAVLEQVLMDIGADGPGGPVR